MAAGAAAAFIIFGALWLSIMMKNLLHHCYTTVDNSLLSVWK
jgi:hypothetical protein